MTLPTQPLATDAFQINGTSVPLRALSRAEVLKMGTIVEAEGDAEAFVIAQSTGESLEEAAKWLDSIDNATGVAIIGAILKLSGIGRGDGPKA